MTVRGIVAVVAFSALVAVIAFLLGYVLGKGL